LPITEKYDFNLFIHHLFLKKITLSNRQLSLGGQDALNELMSSKTEECVAMMMSSCCASAEMQAMSKEAVTATNVGDRPRIGQLISFILNETVAEAPNLNQ